jgi:hypothetical protein
MGPCGSSVGAIHQGGGGLGDRGTVWTSTVWAWEVGPLPVGHGEPQKSLCVFAARDHATWHVPL